MMNARFRIVVVAGLVLAVSQAWSFADDTEAEIVARARDIVAGAQDADVASRNAAMDRLIEELDPLRANNSDLNYALNLLSWVREYDDWQRSEPIAKALAALAGASNEDQRQQALGRLREETLNAGNHLVDRLGSSELDEETVDALALLADEVQKILQGENRDGPSFARAIELAGKIVTVLKNQDLQDGDAAAVAELVQDVLGAFPGISSGPLSAFATPQAMSVAQIGVVKDGVTQCATALELVGAAMDENQNALERLPAAARQVELTLSAREFCRRIGQAVLGDAYPFLVEVFEMFADPPIPASWNGRWSSNLDMLDITEAGIVPVGWLGRTYHYEFHCGGAGGDTIRGSYTSDGKEGTFMIFLDGVTITGTPMFSGHFTVEGSPHERRFWGHLMSRQTGG